MHGGLYRRDGILHRPGAAAHLWPFSRALVATIDLGGIPDDLLEGFDADAAIASDLGALERYWVASRDPPAYSSDVVGTRLGGDRYYDDNAWVGLALIELERTRPGGGHLARAEELLRFAASGWDQGEVPPPGGVFWVEQGRGIGATNHDRNTVSNAPNAELGLHLAELGAGLGATSAVAAEKMYEWVLATLDASRDTDFPGTGLFWDKLRGDGTIDPALWSYNQGSMVGASVLLARRGGEAPAAYLARAEAIARKSLKHFAGEGYEHQPPAFNAIFFRNLLILHDATRDEQLRAEILAAVRGYSDGAWFDRRDRRDLFHLSKGGVTLLNQSAMVQLFALLAWDPSAYRRLA